MYSWRFNLFRISRKNNRIKKAVPKGQPLLKGVRNINFREPRIKLT
ncbi:hypothetical protein ADIS_2542 [Lunatimonas lonarensis]|uniref:Uncharacterized protein n=1 Tax=Lunatimonas lonarensis TaxID=1232681 RepID=R7ZSK6_9BACT|nr:hypothetical protein ADIS_2542 [Lunatimonas lonarensis]